MKINELVKKSHAIALSKGFWEKNKNIPEKIMLVVTELAESVEALRKDCRQSNAGYVYNNGVNTYSKKAAKTLWCKDSFDDELADAVIRIADLCGYMKVNLEWQIKKKLAYNLTRPRLHGKKF